MQFSFAYLQFREVSPLSVITVQVFDQKKFVEAKDQGFLGLVKVSLQKNIDLNNEFEETTLELALNDSFSQTVAQGSIKLSVVVLPGKLPANSSSNSLTSKLFEKCFYFLIIQNRKVLN